MKLISPLSVLPFLLALASCGNASHRHRRYLSGRQGLSLSGITTSVDDTQDINYFVNITLNGELFTVLMDTGSSDLWISAPVPNAVPQNYTSIVSYAAGSASGEVYSATLELAGVTVESQFFMEALNATVPGAVDGIMGLGPSGASDIRVRGNSSAANPPLDRIFSSNSSLESYIAIHLRRSEDPDDPYPGELSIGDVLTEFKDIFNQPRLPLTLTNVDHDQHWQILLDVDGITGPNNKSINVTTQVTGAQTKNATVVFDTGFSLSQVPPYIAEAFYSGVPGAALRSVSGAGLIWTLPCEQEVDVTFTFAGVNIPIHPLDTNFNATFLDEPVCLGAFQPLSFDNTADSVIPYDMILGMNFIRNVYLLVNFGSFVNNTEPSTSTGYVQLLPITNATQASQDFATLRKGSGTGGKYRTTLRVVFWVAIGVLVVLIVTCVACCYRCRRKRNTIAPSTAWASSYRPVDDPSPQAAYDMYMIPGASPQHPPEYKTAWDTSRRGL